MIATHHRKNKGFTLTELLVVVMIMVILMGIGGISLLQINSGRGIEGGVSSLQSTIQSARELAMARQANVRVLFHNDLSDRKNYLRQVSTVILTASSDPDDGPEWKPVFNPVFLPSKVYFDFDQSVNTTTALGELGDDSEGEFVKGKELEDKYIEFNQLGICVDSDAVGDAVLAGANVVLVSGRLRGDDLRTDNKQKVGLVVWRNGSSTLVDDINLISGSED